MCNVCRTGPDPGPAVALTTTPASSASPSSVLQQTRGVHQSATFGATQLSSVATWWRFVFKSAVCLQCRWNRLQLRLRGHHYGCCTSSKKCVQTKNLWLGIFKQVPFLQTLTPSLSCCLIHASAVSDFFISSRTSRPDGSRLCLQSSGPG